MHFTSFSAFVQCIMSASHLVKGMNRTLYKQDGVELSTTERVVKDVEYPASLPPTDAELFDDFEKCEVNIKFLTEHFRKEGRLTQEQAMKIILKCEEILSKEPNLLKLQLPITICGDIHGQYYDLLKLFEVGGDVSKTQYLFMGDYVDRGYFGIECVLLLYSLKIRYPNRFFMLRGNHECRHLTSYFTFKRECEHKYNIELYDRCMTSFDALPLAAVVNKEFFCVHGGLSPKLNTPQDVMAIDRFKEPPTKGLLCDLLWADPHEDFGEENDSREFIPNSVRGCSYFYTYKATTAFLKRSGLLSVIRAHEAQDAGYRTYKKNKSTGFPSVITIFSAPNYLDAYNNKAAVLKYENHELNIKQFNSSPHPYWLPNFMDVFTWSLPFVGEKVSEMLAAILNTCTREELDQPQNVPQTEMARVMAAVSAGQQRQRELKEKRMKAEMPPMSEETLNKFRNKVLAIGRISRMFSVLREESELISEFKGVNNMEHLPKGTLMLGAAGVRDCIHNFEEARVADLENEGLPPAEAENEERVKLRRQQSLKRHQLN